MFSTTSRGQRAHSCSIHFPTASLEMAVEPTTDIQSLVELPSSRSNLNTSDTYNDEIPDNETTKLEKDEKEPGISANNVFEKITHSFKRSKDVDLESGIVEMDPKLSNFNIQMICFGGSIGTGLFIALSKSLTAGPLLMLLCYFMVSTFIYCMCQALCELSVSMKVTGSFTNYSTKLINKSWGLAMGWNYCLQWMFLLPMELVAATMAFDYWPFFNGRISHTVIITVFYISIIIMNLFSVEYYGIAESVFSIIKIAAIVIFAFIAVLIDTGALGGDVIGFRYWRNPGLIAPNGLNLFTQVFITSVFSFAGSELV